MHADFETLYLGNHASSSVDELSGETIQALVDTLERRYIAIRVLVGVKWSSYYSLVAPSRLVSLAM